MKSIVATVSYDAGILVQKAGATTQVVCNKLYGHYYLLKTPELEQMITNDLLIHAVEGNTIKLSL